MDSSHSSQRHESQIEAQDNLDSWVVNYISRLICENGLGPDFLQPPYFEGVLDLLTTVMPTYGDSLQVQLREVQQRERYLKQQWERTGCSLILDRWTSRCGKNLISILVHCSAGVLFLRSMDISTIFDDVDELASMICEVVDEIGAGNIVQIISNDASPHMQAAERVVLNKYDDSFSFALCADFCINLLLEKIAALDNVSGVLFKAKQITRFVYSHALPMELKEFYIPDGEIISNSNLEYVAVFVTLERLVSHRAKLVEMFSSPRWRSSDLASTNLSMQICEIIQSDNAFWSAAAKVLKVTSPIVNVLLKLETYNSMGVLYDAMDNAKDEIKQNIGHEYGRYWSMVDQIWDNYLHCRIHAAGYVLNPKIFYSEGFCMDGEICSGISSCIHRVAKSQHNASLVWDQFELYLSKLGLFDSDTAAREAMEIPQGSWWLKHGVESEALQSVANRILSQPCFGASRYNLDKSLSERLHTEARSYPDQEKFRKLEYIHYNLRLRNSVPRLGGPPQCTGKLTTKLGDWISGA